MGSYKTVITLVKNEYSNIRGCCISAGCCLIDNIYSSTTNTVNSYLNWHVTQMCTKSCIKEKGKPIKWCYNYSSVNIVSKNVPSSMSPPPEVNLADVIVHRYNCYISTNALPDTQIDHLILISVKNVINYFSLLPFIKVYATLSSIFQFVFLFKNIHYKFLDRTVWAS